MEPAASGKSIGRGVLWSTLAFVCGRALTFISLLVVARMVTPTDFGVVAAVLAYLAILELLSDLGMRATVVYEQEHGITERVDVAFTLGVVIAALLTVAGVVCAPIVAGFFGAEEQTWLFRLAAANLLLGGLGNVHDGLLVRELAFRRRTIPLLARGAVRGAVTIALAVSGVGAASLVFGLLAGSAARTLLLWALASEHPRLRFDRTIARSMASYGTGAAALQIIAVVGGKLDVMVIGRALGQQALGVYALAYRLPELLIESVAWNVSDVAFPALAARRGTEGDLGAVRTTTLDLVRWQVLYAIPVALGLAVMAPSIVVVLFGEQWRSAAGVLVAISVAEIVEVAIFSFGDAFRAIGRQGAFIALQLVVVPILAVLIVLAAPYGLTAVAWMRVVDIVLFGSGVVFLARRTLGLRLRALAAAFGPGAVAGVGVVIGAGALRLAWPATTAPQLLAGIVCGAAGATLALRVAQPAVLGELLAVAGRLLRRARGRFGRPTAPAPV